MKTIKKASLLFASLALVLGAGLVSNSDTKEVKAAGTEIQLSSEAEVSNSDLTISFATGSGNNAPKWYEAGLRLYGSNTVTVKSKEKKITKITFNWEKQGKKDFASATANVGDYSHPTAAGDGVWTGSSDSITFTLGASGQLQLNTLTYELDESTTTPVNITGVKAENLEVLVGESKSTTLTYEPADTTQKSFEFTSADENIATVDKNSGLVTGVSSGSTTINVVSVANENVKTSFTVTVTIPESITIDYTAVTSAGWTKTYGTTKRTATINDYEFVDFGGGTYTKSGKNYVALKNATTSYFYNNVELCRGFITKIEIDFSSGGTNTFGVYEASEAGGNDTLVNPEAVVSASGVATYNFTGQNKFFRMNVIKAQYANINSIKVYTSATKAEDKGLESISTSSVEMKVGKKVQTPVSFVPEDTTDKAVSYESKDPNIATVTEDGVIEGISAGETIITITSQTNSNIKAKCNVKILPLSIPTHAGTVEDPYTIEDAILVADNVGTTPTAEKYYIKGIVCEYDPIEKDVEDYGNITFSLSDSGIVEEGKVFLAYQVYYLNNKKFTSTNQISVGDEVVLYSKIQNFNDNTPETTNKGSAYVYSQVTVADKFVSKVKAFNFCNASAEEIKAMLDEYNALVDKNADLANKEVDETTTLAERMAYMQLIYNKKANTTGESTSGVVITSNNSFDKTSLIALFAILGIVTISGYYIIEKKKFSK